MGVSGASFIQTPTGHFEEVPQDDGQEAWVSFLAEGNYMQAHRRG